MSRPPRQAKVKALKAFENDVDDEEPQCPPPLAEILASRRGFPSTSSSSSLYQAGGRGLLSASVPRFQPGNSSISLSSSSIGGGRGLLSASISRVRQGVSRIAKVQALQALEESEDSASEEESNSEEENENDEDNIDVGDTADQSDTDNDSEKESDESCYATVNSQFRGRDSTLWFRNPNQCGRIQALNVMRSPGGLSAFGRRHSRESAISNWRLFIDDELLDLIVECTNEKARSEKDDFVTNRDELVTYIGVGILIGVYKGKNEPVRALWSPAEGRKCIMQFMSRTRYELISKYLRFDVTSTRQRRRQETKFAPMGAVYDMWEQRLSKPFIPYEYVTVDETLVAFRGRCRFKQYMPSKPAKYGLKFWCLCDAATGYCLRMKPYLGLDSAGGARATGLGQHVVLDLTERLDVGRTVVTDNFFTSLALAQKLRDRNLGLIGTVRKNRREVPEEFIQKRSEAGTSMFGFNKDATLVSYAPKKNRCVILISSEHTQPNIDTESGKPEIILAYNHGKGGVDHLDQMCGAYTSRKRTSRWPKCVFQHMVDVTAFNTFVIWKETIGNKLASRRQFLKLLGAELCGGEVDTRGNIILAAMESLSPAITTSNTMSVRLRCRKCKTNKTVQRCKKCGNPLCINCASYNCDTC